MTPMSRTTKLILVLGLALVVLAALGLRSCEEAREVRRDADLVGDARKADAKAHDARTTTTEIIGNDRQEIENALERLPDAPLTDRQHARACATWLRQHGSAHPTCS
jgi:hypothetical protein